MSRFNQPSHYNYNNSAAVANSEEVLLDYQRKSLDVYQQYAVERNIAYADHPRATLDWFYLPSHKRQGVFIFIHGGYWQYCNKEDFACIVPAVLSHNIEVILLEYPLAPEANLTTIVKSIGDALTFIQHNTTLFSDEGQPYILSGHSAGGHLSAYWQSHDLISRVLALSGIFELAPIQETIFNHNLRLSIQEVETLSPLQIKTNTHKPITIIVGEHELPELIDQSETYYQSLKDKQVNAHYALVEKANHFSILDRFFQPGSELLKQSLLKGLL